MTDPVGRPAGEATAEKTPVRIHLLDVRFSPDADMDDLFAAIEPPPDVAVQLSIRGFELPDGIDRRLQAWGYAGDPYGDFRRTGRLSTLGVYGDWTLYEDDERFMPLIAPFVTHGSHIVFEKSRAPGTNEWWDMDHQAWTFLDGAVRLTTAEREIEWWTP